MDVAHRQGGGGVAGQGGVEGAVVRGKEERRVTDDTLIHPAGIKKRKAKQMTDLEEKQKKKPCSTVKQGECTRVLLSIPHLLLLNRLIERVGARPLTSLPLEN